MQYVLRVLYLLVAMFFMAIQVSYAQKEGISTDQHVVSEKAFDTTKLSKRAKFTVRFSRGEGRYAFDEGREDWLQDSKLLRDEFYKPFGDNYVAPWKLVPEGRSDKVLAEIKGALDIDASKIKFVLQDGTGVLMDRKEGVKMQNKTFEYEINGTIQGTYLLHLQTKVDKSVLQVVVERK